MRQHRGVGIASLHLVELQEPSVSYFGRAPKGNGFRHTEGTAWVSGDFEKLLCLKYALAFRVISYFTSGIS